MGKENLEMFLEILEEKYGKLSNEVINYVKNLRTPTNLKVNYLYMIEMFESEKIAKAIEKTHLCRELKNLKKLTGTELVKYDVKIVLKKYPRFSKYKSLKKNPLHGITDEHKEVTKNQKLYPKLSRENMDLIEERKGKYDDFLL